MNRRSADELLEEALAHLEFAAEYASEDLTRQIVLDAASLWLSAAIDVLSRLDDDTRRDLFGHEWKVMWGMRNRIAHGCFLDDSRVVRETLAVDLPEPVEALRRAHRDISDGS